MVLAVVVGLPSKSQANEEPDHSCSPMAVQTMLNLGIMSDNLFIRVADRTFVDHIIKILRDPLVDETSGAIKDPTLMRMRIDLGVQRIFNPKKWRTMHFVISPKDKYEVVGYGTIHNYGATGEPRLLPLVLAESGTMPPSAKWAAVGQNSTVPRETWVEVGYAFSSGNWGKGYATEFVSNMVRVAYDAGADGVMAKVLPTNPASARVLEKNGFTLISVSTDNPDRPKGIHVNNRQYNFYAKRLRPTKKI